MVTVWICSDCGRDKATSSGARPSIDDRYAVGYCESCCPVPVQDPDDPTKTRPRNRKTVALVRSDVWDPAVLRVRREQAHIRRLFNGKGSRTEAEVEEMAALRRKWEAEAEARRSA